MDDDVYLNRLELIAKPFIHNLKNENKLSSAFRVTHDDVVI
jgi:hypothetical protein